MEEILFETLNFCRICLRENDDLKCIFTATVNSVELPKIIMSLAPIFILENDGLSAKVCTDCQEKVDSAYKLQKLCVQSDKNQREMLYLPAVEDVDAIKIETETVNVNSEINFEIRYCNENDNVAKAHYSKATDDVNLLVKAGPLEIRDKIEQLYKNKTVRPPKFPVAKIVNVTRNTRVPERIKKPLPSIPPKRTYDTSKSSCDICCKTFFNLASLKRHKLTDVHNSSKRTLKCPVCPKMFVTMPVYKRHLDFHGIVKALKYNCKYCPKSYDTKQAIGSHYKIHYKEFGHQKYYCDNCPKSFDKLCFLSIHMRKHMVLKFRCNTCYALFADQESLDEHGLKHEGVKYTCDICGKEFKYSLHLRMHKRLVCLHSVNAQMLIILLLFKAPHQFERILMSSLWHVLEKLVQLATTYSKTRYRR